jgi:hypothetical protein
MLASFVTLAGADVAALYSWGEVPDAVNGQRRASAGPSGPLNGTEFIIAGLVCLREDFTA